MANKDQEEPYSGHTHKYKQSKLEKLLITVVVLGIILWLFYALFVTGYIVFGAKYFDKSNYVADTDYTIAETIEPETYVDENGQIQIEKEATLDDEEAEKVLLNHRKALDNLEDITEEDTGTYNLLLIGVDSRNESVTGNSDVMMLITVNNDKKTIYITSFLRDLYANIDTIGVRKLNASCAYGGPLLCVDTIKSNYGVEIDNYAMVNFSAMINIVDVLGGIDMEITEDEANVCNGYIKSMCQAEGISPDSHYFTGEGLVHMDGYQAVAYARNRYSGNRYDFGRTERQRKIVKAILEKAKSGGLGSISDAAESVLPYITHNISESTILSLLPKMIKWTTYSVVDQHIPYDNEYYVQNEILIPNDIGETIAKLRETIY